MYVVCFFGVRKGRKCSKCESVCGGRTHVRTSSNVQKKNELKTNNIDWSGWKKQHGWQETGVKVKLFRIYLDKNLTFKSYHFIKVNQKDAGEYNSAHSFLHSDKPHTA